MSLINFMRSILDELHREFKEEKDIIGLTPKDENDAYAYWNECLSSWDSLGAFASVDALYLDIKILFLTLYTAYYLTWKLGGLCFFYTGIVIIYCLLQDMENASIQCKHLVDSLVGFFYFYLLTIYETIKQFMCLAIRLVLTACYLIHYVCNLIFESSYLLTYTPNQQLPMAAEDMNSEFYDAERAINSNIAL